MFEGNKIINFFQRLATINLRNIILLVILEAWFNLQRGLGVMSAIVIREGVFGASNKSANNQIMSDNYDPSKAVSPGFIISTEIATLSHPVVMRS